MRQLIAAVMLLAACGGSSGTPKTCTPPACLPETPSYGIEIVGNADTPFPATDLTEVSLDGTNGVLTLDLPKSAQVSGHVTAAGAPVPASVTFSRPSAIPGRPDVSYQAPLDATDGSYSVTLPPSVGAATYTIRVRPTDPTKFPPLTLTQSITADTALELALPSGNTLVHFHGTLANAVSVGIAQATVVLRDATTLDDLSTTSTTSTDGSFDLYLSAFAAAAADGIELVAQHGDATTGLITLTLPLSAAQVTTSSTSATAALALPALPSTTHLSIPVVGTSSSGTIGPVIGATFRIYASLGAYVPPGQDMGVQALGESVVHEVDGQTDANGDIQADLFSDASGVRSYYVTIVPPADLHFETPAAPIAVSVGTASGVSQPITLTPQPSITGAVLDPTGAALANATVQPALSTIRASSSSALSSTPASTTTDPKGRFVLYLDPNTYDIAVSPPATESLPRRWLSRETFTGDDSLGNVQLPNSVMFNVLLKDASGTPVQAAVRLYILSSSDPDCTADMAATGTCVAAPQLQAEVATGADGSATLLLPSQ